MKRGDRVAILLLLLLFAGFVGGICWVFALQFSRGASYPAASSLRAEPNGTMLLYESLERMPGLQVRRHLDPLRRLRSSPERSLLFVLNADAEVAADTDLHAFVSAGGRVVFQPSVPDRRRTAPEEPELEASATPTPLPLDSAALPLRVRRIEGAEPGVALRSAVETGAPLDIVWPQGSLFVLPKGGTPSEVLYRQDGKPVVLRVRQGKGEWILLADAYPLENHTLFSEAPSEWIAWLMQDRSDIYFHEYHFGIQQARGIMTLIRSSGLTGLLVAMAIPFLLLLWRGAVPLLPALDETKEPQRTAKSRLDAFRDLLTRHLPDSEILDHCLQACSTDFRIPDELRSAAENEIRRPLPKKNRRAHLTETLQRLHLLLTQKRPRP